MGGRADQAAVVSAIEYVHRAVIPAAYTVLRAAGAPQAMESVSANAMLLAIGLQESGFSTRRQDGGPARGFWQAEITGGFPRLLSHHATRDVARAVLARMAYKVSPESLPALEHNDILSCVGARLLLWTHPQALPDADEPEVAWHYYEDLWRPGRPRREPWDGFYAEAWTREVGA